MTINRFGFDEAAAPERELIKTKTGEVFQPIRLYYHVHSSTGIKVAFKKLRCIDYERADDHWVWVYDNEAKKIEFEISHAAIHPDDKPLILGIFSSISDDQLCLDVGSIERALKAIAFFNKHIKRFVAEIEFVAIHNRLPKNRNDYPGIRYDKIFGEFDTSDIEIKAADRAAKFEDAIARGNFEEELDKICFDQIEGFRVNNDDEGLMFLSIELRMRQGMAAARWKGNKDIGLNSMIKHFASMLDRGKLN
jgi:hypothetical protein